MLNNHLLMYEFTVEADQMLLINGFPNWKECCERPILTYSRRKRGVMTALNYLTTTKRAGNPRQFQQRVSVALTWKLRARTTMRGF